ncbi:hypothetical protein Cni_G01252 [Canna indica]|uniref:Uncharacterized protein n=1 Tax=Canna indica TaxID=4628 RepID=A0AAQ3JPC9_9LILI|nr:hypothetical protein Cni_G01252 [Canna indica]
MEAEEQQQLPITIPIATTTSVSLLTGFHAGYFRISLSLCAQALLWKTLRESTTSAAGPFPRLAAMLPSAAFIVIWSVALSSLAALCLLYSCRCLFKFRHVQAEFLNHVGVNYLFAPWISGLLLLQSAPFRHGGGHDALWWAFSAPILALDVKIYGQWFTKGRTFLTAVANPASQITVIANLVGARAAGEMGREEAATLMFAVGMVHYLVLFVTLYQRFEESNGLPPALRPVFFLFIAAPSVASSAWKSISGSFDTASKMLFFLSLFLFASLVSRPALFKRSMRRFNIAWWAYSFPLTTVAMAAAEYAKEVTGGIASALVLMLTALSVVVVVFLLAFTAVKTSDLLPRGDDDPFKPISQVAPST